MVLSNNDLDKITGGIGFFATLRESFNSCFGSRHQTISTNKSSIPPLVTIKRRNGHIRIIELNSMESTN